MIQNQLNPFTFEYLFTKSAFKPINWNQRTKNSMKSLKQFKIYEQNIEVSIPIYQQYSEIRNQNSFLKEKNIEKDNEHFDRELEKTSNITFLNGEFSQKNEIEKLSDVGISQKSLHQNDRKTRLRSKKPFKYDFDSDQQSDQKLIKSCETKNIIKNFIRSVINFIKKNKNYQQKILDHQRINYQQFFIFLTQIQGKVNTIPQLREFWTTNKYSKVIRLISSYFLRAYYPKHIFNSRILNRSIHLKYRIKLLKSLENPSQFTSLKEF